MVVHNRNGLPPTPVGLISLELLNVIGFLALINAFVHSRDGYTAVVPTGLILSVLVVAILLCATAWTGREAVYSHRVGDLN